MGTFKVGTGGFLSIFDVFLVSGCAGSATEMLLRPLGKMVKNATKTMGFIPSPRVSSAAKHFVAGQIPVFAIASSPSDLALRQLTYACHRQ
jgi:hypothetical protein